MLSLNACATVGANGYVLPDKHQELALQYDLEQCMDLMHLYMNYTDMVHGNANSWRAVTLLTTITDYSSYEEAMAFFLDQVFLFSYYNQGKMFTWLELPYVDYDKMTISLSVLYIDNSVMWNINYEID